jgi:phage tail sheath gpL-like
MSGSVTFSIIPPTLRNPGTYFEIDASNANSLQGLDQRALIIAQMTSAGSATPGQAFLMTSVGDTQAKCGVGSQVDVMAQAYRKSDPYGTTYILPIMDDPAATATQVAATVTGTAVEAGTLSLYVAGTSVHVGVHAGDTAATVASAIETAMAKRPDLPATATAAAGVVTFTANNGGVAAGDLDVRLNYYGLANSEITPSGIDVTFVTTAGTGDPDPTVITNALATIPDDFALTFIVYPYNTAPLLKAIEDFLSDVSGTWSYAKQTWGGAFTAFRGTVSQATSWGLAKNNQHVSCLPFYDSPTSVSVVAADYAGTCARSLRADPALPLQNIALSSLLAPPVTSRYDFSERNTLLWSGCSTFRVNPDGTPILERSVTTYQEAASGVPDNSYLDTETPFTLAWVIQDLRMDLATKFARKKLVDDNARISYGQNFVSARTVKSEAISNYRKNAQRGLVTAPDEYASAIVAENQGNGRVALMCPFTLANQLRQIYVSVQFQKN